MKDGRVAGLGPCPESPGGENGQHQQEEDGAGRRQPARDHGRSAEAVENDFWITGHRFHGMNG